MTSLIGRLGMVAVSCWSLRRRWRQPARPSAGAQAPLTVSSPNGAIVVTVTAGADLSWSVTMDGRPVLLPSKIALSLDGNRTLGAPAAVRTTSTRTVDQVLRPVVRVKRAEVRDRFNERRIDFTGDYSLIVRAYDDGVAYRFVTRLPGDIQVLGEEASLCFAGDHPMYFPEETSFQSHQERSYKRVKISEVGAKFSSLPAIVEVLGRAEGGHHRGGPLRLPGDGPDGRADAEQPQGALPVLPGQGRTAPRPRRERRRTRAVHGPDQGDARLPLAGAGARLARHHAARHRHRLPPGRPSRNWPTRAGSSRGRSPGTGGTTTTSTACRSAPA